MKSIRVIVADDHPIIQSGIERELNAANHITVVDVVANFAQLLASMQLHKPDVVVLDLNGMGVQPLTMVDTLRRVHEDTEIVAFSSSVDIAPELQRQGVRGYVAKEDILVHLIDAIMAVTAQRQYMSPAVQRYLDHISEYSIPPMISPKEHRVLQLLSQGLSTEDIAEVLHVDPRTVQNHITNLRRKTRCKQRTLLVDFFRRNFDASGAEV